MKAFRITKRVATKVVVHIWNAAIYTTSPSEAEYPEKGTLGPYLASLCSTRYEKHVLASDLFRIV